MALRSSDRKLSFEILSRSNFDDEDEQGWENSFIYCSKSDPIQSNLTRSAYSAEKPSRKKRNKKKKKKTMTTMENSSIPEDLITEQEFNSDSVSCNSIITNAADSGNGNIRGGLGLELKCEGCCSVATTTTTTVVCEESGGSVFTVTEVPADRAETQSFRGDVFKFGELRQRSVNGIGIGGESNDGVHEDSVLSRVVNDEKQESGVEVNSGAKQRSEHQANGNVVTRLETAESLDWKRLMAEDPNYLCSVEQWPIKHYVEEMFNANSLQSTTTLGNEEGRERVYDTIFRLPWRCELLINVGFFVCFDSFLSLLTIMPARTLMTLWRLLKTRQFKRPSAVELSDFGCFIIMACGVVLLERTDISLIYHMIRGQGTIKLYVVYNVLEIFDKLCQSFSGDVLQTLFNTAEGLANSGEENRNFWIWRYLSDQALAVAASIVHSFVLLAQAITLSTCIVAHNNALLALLVSNNFSEIKSNVFKRFSKENIHSLVYFDSVERFHISAFLLFVLAQNILEAEGPWFESFVSNALLVFLCEMAIDIIKHSFIAKFNDIKPIAFSEFLEDLCKQTLNIQTGDVKKNLTFVPLAPACVVIRVLTPVYAARIPYSPLSLRLFWILLLFAMTYVMLTSLKVLIGLGLQKHATWYINRCQRRRHHLHYD